MPKLVRLVLVVPTLAIMALASATAAFADNGVSVSVDPTATLTAKVQVVATITASCPAGWYTMGSQVTIEQATGREIAHGTGYIPLQCTGLNQVFSVAILADPSGPPFRNGPALVSASVNACNYGMVFTCASATANTTVKLR